MERSLLVQAVIERPAPGVSVMHRCMKHEVSYVCNCWRFGLLATPKAQVTYQERKVVQEVTERIVLQIHHVNLIS